MSEVAQRCKVTRHNGHITIHFWDDVSHGDRVAVRNHISSGLRLKRVKIHGRGRRAYITAQVIVDGVVGSERGRLVRGVRDAVANQVNDHLDNLQRKRTEVSRAVHADGSSRR